MSTITYGTFSPAPRLRITSRGRAVLFGIVAVPAAVIAVMLGLGAPEAVATDTAVTSSFTYVTIEPGQSLWQVAQQIAPQADPRDVVDSMLSLNHLSSADVQPGQELAVPAEYAG